MSTAFMSKTSGIDRCRCIVDTQAEHTRYGEVPQYKEGLYELGNRLYAWLVPNGSWGESNAGLIIGDDEALLVDTLWDVQHTRTMLRAMETVLAGVRLKYVVNTHADGDHFWGNELVTHAEIITSQAAYDEMKTSNPRSMILQEMLGRILSLVHFAKMDKVGHWLQTMALPYDFRGIKLTPARRQFTGEMKLWVGDRMVQLIEVGPAHTRGDLLVYVPDAKVLYSGDIVFVGSTPVMWAGPVKNCLAAIDRILNIDVEVVVPGHGPLTDMVGAQQVKTYWEYIDHQVCQCYELGMSAEGAARDIALSQEFARLSFANWNSPERIMVNTHTQYRYLARHKEPPNTLESFGIMVKQALLAQELPDAQPRIMHRC
jgi:cyclase